MLTIRCSLFSSVSLAGNKATSFFFTIIKSSFQLLGHFKFSPIGFCIFYAALSVLLKFSCSVHALTHYHRTSATSQLITVMPYMTIGHCTVKKELCGFAILTMSRNKHVQGCKLSIQKVCVTPQPKSYVLMFNAAVLLLIHYTSTHSHKQFCYT